MPLTFRPEVPERSSVFVGRGGHGFGAAMIHSLFLINSSGDIFLEKHWKSVVSRSVCDYFFEAQERASEAENVPPVISTPHHYLLSVYRHKIFFVAVIQTEVPPLFVIEFLHRVVDTFQKSLSAQFLHLHFWILFAIRFISER
uniref:Uncharacterized protein n=1 Tax=Varanus komodoensis TaxID=61221 RepID=A0A8D2KX06_VARKO